METRSVDAGNQTVKEVHERNELRRLRRMHGCRVVALVVVGRHLSRFRNATIRHRFLEIFDGGHQFFFQIAALGFGFSGTALCEFLSADGGAHQGNHHDGTVDPLEIVFKVPLRWIRGKRCRNFEVRIGIVVRTTALFDRHARDRRIHIAFTAAVGRRQVRCRPTSRLHVHHLTRSRMIRRLGLTRRLGGWRSFFRRLRRFFSGGSRLGADFRLLQVVDNQRSGRFFYLGRFALIRIRRHDSRGLIGFRHI